MVTRLFDRDLHVNAVMGNAEDAQLNGLNRCPTFHNATKSMSYFHVLYNIHKRVRHLTEASAVKSSWESPAYILQHPTASFCRRNKCLGQVAYDTESSQLR
jgi:hypothetical protein